MGRHLELKGTHTPLEDPGMCPWCNLCQCNFCNFYLACPFNNPKTKQTAKKQTTDCNANEILPNCIHYPNLDALCFCLPRCYALAFRIYVWAFRCRWEHTRFAGYAMFIKTILANKMTLLDQINLKILYVGFIFKKNWWNLTSPENPELYIIPAACYKHFVC